MCHTTYLEYPLCPHHELREQHVCDASLEKARLVHRSRELNLVLDTERIRELEELCNAEFDVWILARDGEGICAECRAQGEREKGGEKKEDTPEDSGGEGGDEEEDENYGKEKGKGMVRNSGEGRTQRGLYR
jgi:hypothetical protein